MPAFTLYGSRGSSNTDRVRLSLAEGGFTDYEYVTLNLPEKEQKSPEHMKCHPWGKVPTITLKDGLTLYESRPIAKYLASKYAAHLLPSPSDLEAVARFDQASSVELIYFNEHANKIGFEKFPKKIMGLPCNEAVVDEAVKGLNSYFDVAEGILGKQDFMVGDQFMLVDIYYIPLIHRFFICGLGDLITSRKNVNAWWERCMERPAIKKLMQADEEAMKAAMKK